MNMKKILQCLVIVMVISLACAAIYAAKSGEVSHVESSSHAPDGLYISGSGNVCHVNHPTELPQINNIPAAELHI